MEFAVLVALWIGRFVSLVGTWIVCTAHIFKLREGRPDVYAKVGSPSALSRGAEFLWSPKAYEADFGQDEKGRGVLHARPASTSWVRSNIDHTIKGGRA